MDRHSTKSKQNFQIDILNFEIWTLDLIAKEVAPWCTNVSLPHIHPLKPQLTSALLLLGVKSR